MRHLPKRTPDRRIQRSQQALRDALHTLIGEKPYEAIAVKEILGRANVGRSTFYTHFRDKDELLADSIHAMLASIEAVDESQSPQSSERIIRFSRAIFEYHEQHQRLGPHRLTVSTQAALHERLRKMLVHMLAKELRRHRLAHPPRERTMTPELLAEYIASTFIVVLNWWLDSHCVVPAREAHEVFRTFVLPAIVPAVDRADSC